MTRALLDINVLLALVDHSLAHDWLDDEIDAGWASCAITANGFVRIIRTRTCLRWQRPHEGRFITFDHSLPLSSVHGAPKDQLTVL